MSKGEKDRRFDFWYAAAHTEIVMPPSRRLETFGSTLINYHLLAELPDDPRAVRIREGRLEAHKPSIIMPSHLAEADMEGFGPEARKYLEYLRGHEDSVRILQYGYSLKQEAYSELVVHDGMDAALDRVVSGVKEKGNGLDAVLKGVDDPWDVCLVKLFWLEVNASAPVNVREFEAARIGAMREGVAPDVHAEVEKAFERAARDPSLVRALGGYLRDKGVFEQYQDRFFALLRK